MKSRQIPSDLRLVNLKMGGNRAKFTLLTQKLGFSSSTLLLSLTRGIEMSIIVVVGVGVIIITVIECNVRLPWLLT